MECLYLSKTIDNELVYHDIKNALCIVQPNWKCKVHLTRTQNLVESSAKPHMHPSRIVHSLKVYYSCKIILLPLIKITVFDEVVGQWQKTDTFVFNHGFPFPFQSGTWTVLLQNA